MKLLKIILGCCLLSSCVSTKNLPGTYQNICVLYDRLPVVTLTLKSDNTFLYKFPYVDDKIEGTWLVSKDSLVLKSDYFLQPSEPMAPAKKYTDIPGGKDVYVIKGKKLYAVSSSEGIKKSCYLTRVD